MNKVFNRVLIDEVKHDLPANSSPHEIVLEQLIRLHWPAIFWEARRSGLIESEAEDLTQDFFVQLLSDDKLISLYNPKKGSFRTFFLFIFKRFLIDHYRHESAAKRGGVGGDSTEEIVQEDSQSGDGNGDPLCLMDRRWAEGVLVQAEKKVCEYYAKAGKLEI